MHREGQLLRFDTKVNVFRRIAEAAERQLGSAVLELMRAEVQRAAGDSAGFKVTAWEPASGGLADEPVLRIALLEPKYAVSAEEGDTRPLGYEAVRQLWDRPGSLTGKREWRNALILVAPDRGLWETADRATREVLAYEAVLKDIADSRLEVSQSEHRDLQARAKDKRDSLRAAIVAAYRWVFYPGDEDLQVVSLSSNASKGDAVAQRVVQRLSNPDYGTPKVMPQLSATFFSDRIAPRIWPDDTEPRELGELRRRFLQWTYLPILPESDAVLRACIGEGLDLKQWAVAIGDAAATRFTRLVESRHRLDALVDPFDGTAALVRGALWRQVQQALAPGTPDDARGTTGTAERAGAGAPLHQPAPPTIPPPPKRHKRVRITLADLPVAKTNNLQPYLFKVLQGEDAGAQLTLSIDVQSDAGVSDDVLEKRLVEGLEQLGIAVTWQGL